MRKKFQRIRQVKSEGKSENQSQAVQPEGKKKNQKGKHERHPKIRG
jgi:hypothetical protein